ncbi:MAG: hypothetical protein RLZZ342_202 [Candidatus Parcubacteria bacterium]|jgi:FMN phosphatase YigB (HAD superfamily)
MIVILDLDYTLLDSAAFKQRLVDNLRELGVSNEQFFETYNAVRDSVPGQHGYSFGRQADLLHETYGFDTGDVFTQLSRACEALPEFLYPDSIPFLELLKEKHIHTALLTWANRGHQEEKMRYLGISPYFAEIILTEQSKDSVELAFPAPESEWVFINDNPNELRALAARYPEAQMIRIKRPQGKPFTPAEDALDVLAFQTLEEVREYLTL